MSCSGGCCAWPQAGKQPGSSSFAVVQGAAWGCPGKRAAGPQPCSCGTQAGERGYPGCPLYPSAPQSPCSPHKEHQHPFPSPSPRASSHPNSRQHFQPAQVQVAVPQQEAAKLQACAGTGAAPEVSHLSEHTATRELGPATLLSWREGRSCVHVEI